MYSLLDSLQCYCPHQVMEDDDDDNIHDYHRNNDNRDPRERLAKGRAFVVGCLTSSPSVLTAFSHALEPHHVLSDLTTYSTETKIRSNAGRDRLTNRLFATSSVSVSVVDEEGGSSSETTAETTAETIASTDDEDNESSSNRHDALEVARGSSCIARRAREENTRRPVDQNARDADPDARCLGSRSMNDDDDDGLRSATKRKGAWRPTRISEAAPSNHESMRRTDIVPRNHDDNDYEGLETRSASSAVSAKQQFQLSLTTLTW